MPELRHPNLPSEQTITVSDRAARYHLAAGWLRADAPIDPPAEPVKTESTRLDLKKEKQS